MEPPIRAVFTTAEFNNVNICSAEIPSIDLVERPCYYMGTGKVKGSYVRVGDADLPMTDYEIYSFESYRKHVHDDERTVERCSLSIMDESKIDAYIKQKRSEKSQFSMLGKEQTLELLNITRNMIPTLAALLNFCIYPQGFYPQFGITAIVVPGYDIGDAGNSGERFIDNKRIEGKIADMVEESVNFCKRNMKVMTIIDPNTGKRKDKTEYPMNAIREAILNALIHRDYSIHTEGTPVQINFFTDRLEIHSPGNLYGRMTVEQLGYARPDLRNPTLATMEENLTTTENRYSGIPTIRREMKGHGLPEPIFENRRNEFVVILYNSEQDAKDNSNVNINDEIYRLLEFCKEPRTRAEIASFIGVETIYYVMKKYVYPLLDEGRLAMLIPDKPQSKRQKYYTKTVD